MNQDNLDIVLEVSNLTHWFETDGKIKTVLFDINLRILRGEFVALVGPTGCGKSTLLKLILGAYTPTEGRIVVYGKPSMKDGKEVLGLGRDRGIVYQKYSLFPDKTVVENVALGLMLDESSILDRATRFIPLMRKQGRKLSWHQLRKRHLEQATELLARFNLGNDLNKYPYQLSGGMQQRVAVAQALIMEPHLLLLDEPFGALDEATRESIQNMFLELYPEKKCTIIIVTHELNEAIIVGDRVVGLSQYWDSGKEKDKRARGAASVVYDNVSPVFLPDKERDYQLYAKQRREIRRCVFDSSVLQPRDEAVKFWEQHFNGEGRISGNK